MSLVQGIDYAAVGPPLLVAVLAVGVLVLDLLLAGPRAAATVTAVALAGVLAALGWVLALAGAGPRATFCLPADPTACSYVVDPFTVVLQVVVLAGAAVVVLLGAATVTAGRVPAGEYHFLLLASVTGGLALVASRDLATLVVALEVLSLPAFALVALERYDGRASEAALTLFLVSVVSTAVMLYGVALVYGSTGTLHLSRLAGALEAVDPARRPAAAAGVVLALAGFAFKVAAVPFHAWAPDVYDGAPLPVAAYLSVVSKSAGFAGLVLVLGTGFRPYAAVWGPVLAPVAAATMLLGNLVALRQRSAVRLLAWSSIGQSGYMLVPLAVGATAAGRAGLGAALGATVAYVAVYAAMNLGAFSVAHLVAARRPRNLLADYRGLAWAQPAAAGALALALAALAGLPPGLSGLFAKVAVFRAAVSGGLGWLALVMAVASVVGLAYYLAWGVQLFRPALAEGPGSPPAAPVAQPPVRLPVPLAVAVLVTLLATVVLSVAPEVVLQLVAPGALFGG